MFCKIKLLHPDAVVPEFAYPGDCGADLSTVEEVTLEPGEGRDIPIGIAITPPAGYYVAIEPRSSTLRVRGLYVHPGKIDGGYRGPIFVYVRNDNPDPVVVEKGARLAQFIFARREGPKFVVVQELEPSDRGVGGFGSTGR